MKAFPYEESYNHRGMDLRDYFAAKAMAAIISKQSHLQQPNCFLGQDRIRQVSNGAYLYADAMMEARNESK